MDKNRIELRGNLSSDIEVKTQKDNKTWCHFVLCVNEYSPNSKNGEKNIPTFINIACFNEHLTKYLTTYARKGSRVEIEGKLTVTKRERNGYTHFFTNVLMTDGAVLKDKADLEAPNPEESNIENNQPF